MCSSGGGFSDQASGISNFASQIPPGMRNIRADMYGQMDNTPAFNSMNDGSRGNMAWAGGNKMGMMPYGRPQWGFGGIPGFGMAQPTEVMMATLGPESFGGGVRPHPGVGYGGAGFNPFAYGGQGGLLQALTGGRVPMAMTRQPILMQQQGAPNSYVDANGTASRGF